MESGFFFFFFNASPDSRGYETAEGTGLDSKLCSPASSLVRNLCNVGLHMCVNSGGNSAAKTSRVDTFLTLHHVRN